MEVCFTNSRRDLVAPCALDLLGLEGMFDVSPHSSACMIIMVSLLILVLA